MTASGVLAAALLAASGESVVLTNVLGHAISGTLERVDRQAVVLRTGDRVRRIPLAALKPEERTRLKPKPPAASPVERRRAAESRRVDRLEKDGWITKETAEKLRADIRQLAEPR